MRLDFTKMQGVGNDFIVVDGRALPSLDWPALSPTLCDRRFGIGADGILLIEDAPDADAAMRMFNPDGTEDFCGNGLRCVARYVADGRRATDGGRRTADVRSLMIGTIAGVRRAEVHPDGAVTVEMGQPSFQPEDIPLNLSADPSTVHRPPSPVNVYDLTIDGETVAVMPLSTGTAHSVIFAPWPDDERFFRLSPLIEHHPLFPERTSVMWVELDGPGRLRMRIWERGAGETWGCGSGACAAAVAAREQEYRGDKTVVASRGGELRIGWNGVDPIQMTGPAEYVFTGTVDI